MANDITAWKGEVFAQKLIQRLDMVNVLLPLVNRDYEGIIKGKGDTVVVRTIGDITMRPYVGTISYDDLLPGKEIMTIDDADYFAFFVDDTDVAVTDLAIMDLYAQRAAVKVNAAIEAFLLAEIVNGIAASNIIEGTSHAPIALTKDNVYQYFVQARTTLSQNNVPLDGRWAVVDPITIGLLLQSSQFIRSTDLGDRVVQSGVLNSTALTAPGFAGRVAGFDVYESNAIPTDESPTNPTPSQKYLAFGDRGLVSYAAAINETERIRLETKFAWAVRGLLLQGAKVFSGTAHRGALLRVAS